MNIISSSRDHHEILSEAFSFFYINGEPVSIIKSRISNLKTKYRILKFALIFFATFFLIFDIWKIYKNKYIVIREFWNVPLLIFGFLLFPLRKNLFFNINHNLSNIEKKFPLSIKILCKLFKFNFILFDGNKLIQFFPDGIKSNFLFPPFPCVSNQINQNIAKLVINSKPIVGLVGDMRSEKVSLFDLNFIIDALSSNENWNFVVGGTHDKNMSVICLNGLDLIDTTSRSDYLKFLSNACVVVILANRSSYFSRHSGTIIDVIASGAIPVVPNLPVFASQISSPKLVGVTYDSVGEIAAAINFAFERLSFFEKNRKIYFECRSISDASYPG